MHRYLRELMIVGLLMATAPVVALAQTPHWAYSVPKAAAPPSVQQSDWPRNAIDLFVLDAMERAEREPAPQPSAATVVRRLYFDLHGLPPTASEVAQFSANPSEQAYERLVDRLLSSEHFAERMAMYWLDLVRYADTTGVHADNPWDIYPYRDWVIQAFHQNQPFDAFTREQLAGDQLPNATLQQRIGAAYNRLNLVTREGGSQPKEFLARYMADRVRNVSTVWLAATVGCAECHDHKFDPVSARDFYRLGAFFADIKQVGVYSQGAKNGRYFGPYLRVPTDAGKAQLDDLDRRIAVAQGVLDTQTNELAHAEQIWQRDLQDAPVVTPQFGTWHSAGPFTGGSFHDVHQRAFGPESGIDLAARRDGQAIWQARPEWHDAKVHKLVGDRTAYYLYRTIDVASAHAMTLWFGSDDSIQVWLDGKRVLNHETNRAVAPDQERLVVSLDQGQHQLLVKVTNGSGGFGFYFRAELDLPPTEIQTLLQTPANQRDPASVQSISAYFRSITPLLQQSRDELGQLQKQRDGLLASEPVVMATVATTPMTTRVLLRGNWMDATGKIVEPGLPAAFGPLAKRQGRATRLDLANWLVAPENPLVARVFVNRLWRLFFGRGIVRSLDDFGSQGVPPTHPELLDWLAHRFVQSGWDVKAMVRLMLNSSTYRQSSLCNEATARQDPYNDLFSRQARFRHDAEIVRDNALAVSGLLVRKIGGRSVRPYQPPGFYRHLNFPKRQYQQDKGDNLWRRSIYTHWQRQYLHPSLAAFDAPSREECTVERARSNTPLQALVLLNDPILVEAARALAMRMHSEGGDDVQKQIIFAWQTVLSREPNAKELGVMLAHHQRLLAQYTDNPDAAKLLLSIGEHARASDVAAPELAASMGLARVMLSLHESLTRY
ncbi:MAG: hypothetical protein ACI91B_002660 [Planctomycetota bacterium]|jgi:hypothetical protein